MERGNSTQRQNTLKHRRPQSKAGAGQNRAGAKAESAQDLTLAPPPEETSSEAYV